MWVHVQFLRMWLISLTPDSAQAIFLDLCSGIPPDEAQGIIWGALPGIELGQFQSRQVCEPPVLVSIFRMLTGVKGRKGNERKFPCFQVSKVIYKDISLVPKHHPSHLARK